MNNEPIAYWDGKHFASKDKSSLSDIPLYTQDQLEEARKLGMQQERALWNLSASTQEIDQHLTAADAPFQKPAPKELADEIDKALGIKR